METLKAGFQHADFSTSADFFAWAHFFSLLHRNFHRFNLFVVISAAAVVPVVAAVDKDIQE